MVVPAQPGLYDAGAALPVLLGTRCGGCGAASFPPAAIGCEVCGSVDLQATTMAAAGTLHTFATVHLHRGADVKAPFTVAEIVLDDGPVIRALLTSNDGFAIGDRVVAEWAAVDVGEAGAERVEPRFRRAS